MGSGDWPSGMWPKGGGGGEGEERHSDRTLILTMALILMEAMEAIYQTPILKMLASII